MKVKFCLRRKTMLLLLLFNRSQRDSELAITAGNSYTLILGIMILITLLIFVFNIAFEESAAARQREKLHNPVPPITFAASFGNVSEILRLLNDGAYVDERDWVGQTALHMAAKFGMPEACDALLKHGADAMAKNADYVETPLHNTGKTGNKEIFRLLMDRGVDVNAFAGSADFAGGTPLIYCVQYSNSVEATKLLIENGANISAINFNWQTALHMAIINNNFKMAELILKSGADVNAKDIKGDTPLNMLAQHERPQIPLMALLINNSADVNTVNAKGKTPIQNAADLNNFPVILYLLENGGKWDDLQQKKLNQTPQYQPQDIFPFASPLVFATAYGEAHVVDAWLKKYGPTGVVDQRDWLHQTTLHTATIFGRLRVAKVLLDWKADVNAIDGKGFSPLHHAAKCGDHDLIQLLIDAKADITLNHPDHGTPLATAAHFSNAFLPAMRTLLKADGGGKVVNVADSTLGYTPLHWATFHQNLKAVELLLEHGADIEAKSANGESPLNMLTGSICCYPQLPAVQFLLDRGANINSPDSFNCTPLCKARRAAKRQEVLQYLIDRGAVY